MDPSVLDDDDFAQLPLALACRRVDFDWVSIEPAMGAQGALLIVTGVRHWLNLRVELVPRCYHAIPDFWVIEVVGTLPGHAMRGLIDFNASLSLRGLCGLRGVEIIGATRAERRLVS